MKRIEIGMFAATLVMVGGALAGDVESWANETFSPDGKNVIRLYANPLAYEVVREGVIVVAKSEIGLTVDGARLDGEDAAGRVPPVVKRGTRSGVADAPVYKKSKVDLPRRGRREGGCAEVRTRNAKGQGQGEDSVPHGPWRRIRRSVQSNIS